MSGRPAHLNPNEWKHIQQMNERFPWLVESFRAATAVPAAKRYEWAVNRLKELPRTGFTFNGVPPEDCETIYEHVQAMHSLSRTFSSHALPGRKARAAAVRMIDVHDLPEAIIHDFHRRDPITKEEKRALEESALKILLEHDPRNLRDAFNAYETGESPAAKWVKDLDYISCMNRTLAYQSRYTGVVQRLEEFWDDAHTKPMNTEQGRKMIAELLDKKTKMLAAKPLIRI